MNILLAFLKGAIGILAHSQSLVADGVHSLSDLVTDMAILVGERYWSEPADESHPYGHGRIESFISLGIGYLLGIVGTGLIYHAVTTLPATARDVPAWPAFWAALAAIISKEGLYRWTLKIGKTIKSSAIAANAWHHRSDALSSIPVAIAVAAAHFYPSGYFLDHIAALLVAVLILHASWKIIMPSLYSLLDAAAAREIRQELKKIAESTPGVHSVHALRTRHIGSGLQIDIHVMVDGTLTVREGHQIGGLVRHRLLTEGPDVIDVLIHLEPAESEQEDIE